MLIKEDGYALFLVFIVIAISALIMPSMVRLTISEVCISRNYQSSIKDYYLIEGVVNLALKNVKAKLKESVDKGYITNQDFLTILESKELEILDSNNDTITVKYEIKDITDENSKININSADENMLKALKGVGPILAEKIVSRRGFDSIEEISQVDGIGDIDSEIYKDIKDYITVNSDGKININTASELVLKSLDGINTNLAQRIKDKTPLASKEDVMEVNGIGEGTYDSLADDIRFNSENFKVRLKLTIIPKSMEKEVERLVIID